MIAHDPLHRSGRAELPHPAPTLGEDAQAHERIRMTNPSRWKPSRNIAPHAVPRQVVTLAATSQYRPPQVTRRFAKSAQRRACRSLGFVRQLRRFYETVRLPASVRHRRASFDFPTRSAVLSSAGRRGISRFPIKVLAYMHGVSDRAGSWYTLRWRCTRYGLPTFSRASASRSTCRLRGRACISRLNTRPVRPPVNASTPPSRADPHDSGPLWFANPSTYETFIHDTLPV
jgi:hypothetical protein